MPSIYYEEVDLSQERLESLRRKIDLEVREKKYFRFKAWLHFANLEMWRGQGHHFRYMTGGRAAGSPASYCTCGLVYSSDGEGASLVDIPAGITLDEVQRVRGHRNLPSGRGESVALIVEFFFDNLLKKDLWDVFCQVCGAYEQKKVHEVARRFVKEHNRRCGTSLEGYLEGIGGRG